ncbi:MAG TPA: hypothetical protein VGM88_21855 [Kofleriaceae bacterium]|jgi:hypothetical protein
MKKILLALCLVGGVAYADADPDRAACAAAMNKDPSFAQSIVRTALGKDPQLLAQAGADRAVVQAHEEADAHVRKDEAHVVYAYGAMWLVAALFVVYLWRRQQALKAEIAALRRDLDAAAKEPA